MNQEYPNKELELCFFYALYYYVSCSRNMKHNNKEPVQWNNHFVINVVFLFVMHHFFELALILFLSRLIEIQFPS